MTTQIKLRRDTAANWTASNPVLGLGEVGLETDTRKAKFGDGATAWTGLSYMVAPDASALTTATSFAGDASGLYNALVVAQASGAFALPGDVTITTVGTLDDYAISASAAVLRWNGASALSLSGITGGADGRLLVIANVTAAQTLTLKHDFTSTAANRFYCPSSADLAMPFNTTAVAIYDATSTRWRIFADTTGAGGSVATDAIWDAAGDLVIGTGANTGARLAITVPAANILEVPGVVNGETTVSWKAVHDGTAPVTQAFSDVAAAGTALTAAHRDHKHGMPAGSLNPHGASNHTDITRSIWLVPAAGTPDGLTLTQTGSAPNFMDCYSLPNGSTTGAFWTFEVPDDYVSGNPTATIYWSPSATDGTAHTVRWQYTFKSLGSGSDVIAAGTTTTWTGASAARTINLLVKDTTTSVGAAMVAGDICRLEVQRIGADAADTYVGEVRLHAVRIDYTANQ
jgi:hypothetical protein